MIAANIGPDAVAKPSTPIEVVELATACADRQRLMFRAAAIALTSPNIAERCDAVALDDELETVIDNQAHRVCLLRCHSLACPWSPAWQDAYSTVGSPDTRCDNRRTFVRKRQTQIVASFLARSPTAPACSEPALTVCEEPQPKAATTADAGRTAQVAARFPRRADRCGTYLQDVNAMLRLADPTTSVINDALQSIDINAGNGRLNSQSSR